MICFSILQQIYSQSDRRFSLRLFVIFEEEKNLLARGLPLTILWYNHLISIDFQYIMHYKEVWLPALTDPGLAGKVMHKPEI